MKIFLSCTKARADKGQALVELALSLPMLLALLIGVAEFGRFAYFAIEVTNAAHAGAAYGAQNNITAMDNSGMQSHATSTTGDAADVTAMTAAATQYCLCTGSATHNTCNPKPCSQFITYVQVNTTASVSPMFKYPGLSKTFTLTGQATMRVGQ